VEKKKGFFDKIGAFEESTVLDVISIESFDNNTLENQKYIFENIINMMRE
jgi:hypothetical protein